MDIYLPVAEMPVNVVLLLALGLSVGVLSGMFGIGGGFILTPILIMLGIPPIVAVGTGASLVVATSVSGALAHWSRGNVDAKMGFVLLAGGLVGTTGGIQLQQLLTKLGQIDLFISLCYVIVLGTIGSLMMIEAVNTLRRQRNAKGGPTRRAGQHSWIQRLPLKTRFRRSKIYASAIPFLAIGGFVGLLTAIMGVGGGFLMVPALIYLLKVPTRIVIGTSAFQIVFLTSYATVMQASQNYSVDWLLGLPLTVGGVIGAQTGVRIADRLNAEQLRLLLALLVLAVAVRMSVDLVVKPTELYVLDSRTAPVTAPAAPWQPKPQSPDDALP